MSNRMTEYASDDTFHGLALRYLDDELTADEVDRFLLLTAGNPHRSDQLMTLAWQMRLLTTHPWDETGHAIDSLAEIRALGSTGTESSHDKPAAAPGVLFALRHGYRAFGSRSIVLGTAVLLTTMFFWAVVAFLLMPRWRAAPPGLDLVARNESVGESIGRVIRADGCQWEAADMPTFTGARLVPGKLHLAIGTAEIALNSGVNVVIEGPTVVDLTSDKAIYLGRGKIGATVLPQAIGFTVNTPTATVVDLGTEFEVKVAESGPTEVQVRRGTVEVAQIQAPQINNEAPRSLRLSTGQAVRVDRNESLTVATVTNSFRSYLEGTIHRTDSLDLVDIIAGGDGREHRRDRGLDPATGSVVFPPTKILGRRWDREKDGKIPSRDYLLFTGLHSEGGYRRVSDRLFVDGVAIPNASKGPVQLDSAGHTFDGFPKSEGVTYGPIWAGGEVPEVSGRLKFRTSFDGKVDYANAPNNLIALIANKLITFDLAAIRRAYPDRSPTVFRAVVGVTKTAGRTSEPGSADTWVFVDGEVRHNRLAINSSHGPQTVEISLAPSAKFLTLAATDAGKFHYFDWVMFGNPRIEFAAVGEEQPSQPVSSGK
jgi:hypothetical protein